MDELTIVAVIKVNPEKHVELKPLFAEMIAQTRSEDGCIRYDLHRDNQDASRYLFYETWESRDLWQTHMTSGHVVAFGEAAEEMVVSAKIFEMSKVKS
jgi:quinol monooxygenase YgiN